MLITSFSNQKVKFIRKLEQKKYRQESGLFFIEGLRTVGEAVQTGSPIQSLVVAPELLVSEFGHSLRDHPAVKNIDQIEVSAEIFRKLAHKAGSQGIGAVVQQVCQPLYDLQVQSNDLWVALDAIADPGNLGTIMRTAEAVNARGVILIGQCTDPFDPSAVKASMGALFSLRLIKADWNDFRIWQTTNKVGMVGTSDHTSVNYQDIAYKTPLILLMGSERHGLKENMETACYEMVRIPMAGRSDSLNLSIATAIVLYEIFNQTRKPVTIDS